MTKRPVSKKQTKLTTPARASKAKQAKKAKNAKPTKSTKAVAPALDALDLELNHVVDCLQKATALVPKATLRASDLSGELRQCQALGYNHLAMYALQEVGRWVEAKGKDKVLPAEFWLRLADAAKAMELDPFIPYFLGKADGRTKQTWDDVEVGLAILARELPKPLRTKYKATAKALDAYVLSKAKRADGPNPAFMDLFDGLFELITDPRLPVELDDAAWPIIACNTFDIGLSDGLLPLSFAEVWWRDVPPGKAKKAGKKPAKKPAKKSAKKPAKVTKRR